MPLLGLLFGLAGGVAGSIFGPTGAAVGFGIAAYIGNRISNQRDDPRFQPPDLLNGLNQFGKEIVIGEGTDWYAGSVIELNPNGARKKVLTESDGGFLGTGLFETKVVVGVEWYADFMMCFHRTLKTNGINGILKIKINDQLWFNQSDDATEEESADALRKLNQGRVKFFLGSELQTVDSTLEEWNGTGNVQAYRGLVCVLFKDLRVDSGIPDIKALTDSEGTVEEQAWIEITPNGFSFSARERAGAETLKDRMYVGGGINNGSSLKTWASTGDGVNWRAEPAMPSPLDSFVPVNVNGEIAVVGGNIDGSGTNEDIFVFNGSGWDVIEVPTATQGEKIWARDDYAAFSFKSPTEEREHLVLCGGRARAEYNIEGKIGDHLSDIISTVNYYNWFRRATAGGFSYRSAITNAIAKLDNDNIFLCGGKTELIEDPDNPGSLLSHEALSNMIYKFNAGSTNPSNYTFSAISNAFCKTIIDLDTGEEVPNPDVQFGHDPGAIWGATNHGGKILLFTDGGAADDDPTPGQWKTFESVDGIDWDVSTFSGTPSDFNFGVSSFPAIGNLLESVYVNGGGDGNVTVYNTIYKSTKQTVKSARVPIDELQTRICQQNGLAASQIDVTDLNGLDTGSFAHGREDGRRKSLRLMRTKLYHAANSDFKLKFITRGSSSVVTIPATELGAYVEGQQPPGKLESVRKYEEELPFQTAVHYREPDEDYSEQVQTSEFNKTEEQGGSDAIETIDVYTGQAMTADEAKKAAEALGLQAHLSRNVARTQLGPKYSYLEQTDVITVPDDEINRVVFIPKFQFGAPGIIRVEMEDEDVPLWSQTPVGTVRHSSQSKPRVPSLIPYGTDSRILDIPAIHKEHLKSPGFYLAIAPSNTQVNSNQWIGAALYGSKNGEDYEPMMEVKTSMDTYGVCQTILGEPAYPTEIDYVNKLQVRLHHPEMVVPNATDTELYSGLNYVLVGNEILGIGNGTDLGNQVFEFDTLYRGRLGTEWAVSQHTADERFVLLRDVKRINLFPEFRHSTFYLKVVHINGTIGDSEPIVIKYQNICQKPYAPVIRKVYRDHTGRWHIEFTPQEMAAYPDIDSAKPELQGIYRYWEIDFYNDDDEVFHVVEIDYSSFPRDKYFTYHFVPGEWIKKQDGTQVRVYDSARDWIKFSVYQKSADYGSDGRGYPASGKFDPNGNLVSEQEFMMRIIVMLLVLMIQLQTYGQSTFRTPNLNLPRMQPHETDKSSSFNEAIFSLDVLVQGAVLGIATNVLAASAAEGDAYIVSTTYFEVLEGFTNAIGTATGEFANQESKIAWKYNGRWNFIKPRYEGGLVFNASDRTYYNYNDGELWTKYWTIGSLGTLSTSLGFSITATDGDAAILFSANANGSSILMKDATGNISIKLSSEELIFKPPQITTAQRDQITDVTGAIIFNTDFQRLEYGISAVAGFVPFATQ